MATPQQHPPRKRRLGFLPGWRIFTYVILLFNVVMLVWLISAIASGTSTPTDCGTLSADTCNAAQNVGTGIAAALIIVIWVIGEVILGVIWLVTRPRGRDCPACGRQVKPGNTTCPSCGHDFAAAARLAPTGSTLPPPPPAPPSRPTPPPAAPPAAPPPPSA